MAIHIYVNACIHTYDETEGCMKEEGERKIKGEGGRGRKVEREVEKEREREHYFRLMVQ